MPTLYTNRFTLSNDGKTITAVGGLAFSLNIRTDKIMTGKCYFEVVHEIPSDNWRDFVGIERDALFNQTEAGIRARATLRLNTSPTLWRKYAEGGLRGYTSFNVQPIMANGLVIRVAVDVPSSKVWFAHSYYWDGSSYPPTDPASIWLNDPNYAVYTIDNCVPMIQIRTSSVSTNSVRKTILSNAQDLVYSPPAGFTPLGDI